MRVPTEDNSCASTAMSMTITLPFWGSNRRLPRTVAGKTDPRSDPPPKSAARPFCYPPRRLPVRPDRDPPNLRITAVYEVRLVYTRPGMSPPSAGGVEVYTYVVWVCS